MGISHLATLDSTDTIWVLFCTCLLIFMQAGFSCLEAGSIRSKNSINVVMKNSADLCVSVMLFCLVGFGLMFMDGTPFVGTISPITDGLPSHIYIVFLLQAMFCATAVTIVSGAVAERMSFTGYLFLAAITAGIIYPILGRWIWGGLLFPEDAHGWLADMGFHDFAGATVVHSVGGWIALAAVLTIGPRLGRFGSGSSPIEASSLPLSSLGVFLLWIGWLGFNGGSSLRLDHQTPVILLITILGGVAGLSSSLLASFIKYKKPRVMLMMNGGLAGLVSVTAAADILTLWQAISVGLFAGLLPIIVAPLLEKWQIDDAIGVIPVHLAGGIWGTLVAGIFIPLTAGQTRFEALSIQIIGIIVVAAFAFFSAFGVLSIAKKWIKFRVSTPAEMVGLNIWEHDASTSQLDLIQQMAVQAKTGKFDRLIAVEPQSDAYHIATFYNSVIDKFTQVQQEKNQLLEEAIWLSEHDYLTGLPNRRAMTQALDRELARINRYQRTATVAMLDIDNFKSVNDKYGHDVGDEVIKHIAVLLHENIRETDIVGRVGGEEFCLLMSETSIPQAENTLEKLRTLIQISPIQVKNLRLHVTISIGMAPMVTANSISTVLKQADKALYRAKHQGKNQIAI